MNPARPSDELASVLTGNIPLSEASPAIQSWARKPIYDEAVRILALPNKEARREELRRAPELLQPYIENEVMRIWKLRLTAT